MRVDELLRACALNRWSTIIKYAFYDSSNCKMTIVIGK